MYMDFGYFEPFNVIGSTLRVAFTAFDVLPTTKAPAAAPPIIRSSTGCNSAERWPPASTKPPNTDAQTMMYPTMTNTDCCLRYACAARGLPGAKAGERLLHNGRLIRAPAG